MKTLLIGVGLLAMPALVAAQTYPCGLSTSGVDCEIAIPDDSTPDEIVSTLDVPASSCGTSTRLGHVDVRLEILHDSRGDVLVTLEHPGGQRSAVLEASDDPNDDISQTYPVPNGELNDLARAGRYRLHVSDTSRSGIGALTGWSVILPCPEVSIVATDGSAGPSEADTGTFTIKRTGATDVPLDVTFSVGGTAGGGDVAARGVLVTVPVGAASVVVTVVPVDDDLTGEDAETVIVTVAAGGYTVAAAASATVTLVADGALPPDAGVPDAPIPDAAIPDAPPPDAAPPDAPPAVPDAALVADAPVPAAADAAVAVAVEESGEGCGCRLGHRGSAGAGLTGLAFLLLLTRRRRRPPGA